MEKRIISIIGRTALVIMLCSAPASADEYKREQHARELYQAALAAAGQGNRELAKRNLQQVLAWYPNHPQARRMLAYLSPRFDTLVAKNRKADLARVVLPGIDLERHSLRESLDILHVLIAGAAGEKAVPNFIIQDLGRAFNGRTVTLQLKNIPADVALNYIVDKVRGKIRYDKHAIVITPR